MSLIEQLGGYDCALYEYKNTLLADDFPYLIKATGTKFTRPELGDELLEYRRANNIYEVGDSVVFINDDCEGVFKIIHIGKVQNVVVIFFADGRNTGLNYIRHATDEEIKAGHRL